MSKKVIIIGAGIAGMTAGIYAQRSGFDVTILEQHTIPGGMCTSWRRKGYLFEGGIHWLTGSNPKTGLNELWRDTGALGEHINVRYDEPFQSLEWHGQTIYLYRGLEKLQKHFNEVSPQDSTAIKRLVSDVQALSKLEMPVVDIKGVRAAKPRKMSPGALIKMLPAFPKMGSIGRFSAAEYVSGFKHPALRLLLSSVVPEEYSAASLLFTLATLASGDGGYPEGGSLAMTRHMAETFTSLGGKLLLGTKADKVMSKDGVVVGVSINGEIMPADAVIVTQETLAAAEQLFEPELQDEWIVNLRRETKPALCCFVSIGIKAELPETPMFELEEPILCGGIAYPLLGFNNYSGYTGYAPEGGTSLTTIFIGDTYDYWKKARDEGRYETEKQAVAEQVCRALIKKYPQAESNIDVIDVATPLTYERYTGASKGSWMAVMCKGKSNMSPCPCSVEGISGVYFAGHRTMLPGGLPVALMSGRNAAQMVCRQFNAEFK